ncbi:MAG TPA: hypothetical protein VME92_13550, partial [Acetobacteraceae bacterium]|nr:hypothetical protein [Acetobacteraceae bacterium]
VKAGAALHAVRPKAAALTAFRLRGARQWSPSTGSKAMDIACRRATIAGMQEGCLVPRRRLAALNLGCAG